MLNRLDSTLTMKQVAPGDVAGILHNVRWEQDLFRTLPRLASVECAREVVASSERFVHAYGARKPTNRDYPKLLREQLGCLVETARRLQDDQLLEQVQALEKARGGELAKLQGTHQAYLRRLDALGRH